MVRILGEEPFTRTIGRWHRPRLYGTIVAIYLLAMSVGASIFLAKYIWSETHKDPNAIIYGPGPEFYILPPAGLMAVSGLAVYMLVTDLKGSFIKPFQYAVLFIWSLVAVAVFFGTLISVGEADLRGFGIEDIYLPYIVAYAFAGTNGIMYFFLREAHSLRYSYNIRLRSPVGVISIASIGGFVVLSVWYMVLLANPDLSYLSSGHLPDSLFVQAVRDSPEGKAFLARYPNSDVYVFQDPQNPNCCSVTLGYLRDKTDACFSDEREYWCRPQGPGATLYSHVNWSSDTRQAYVSGFSMSCEPVANAGPAAGWTVKGNIVQNLAPGKPDCWDTGPPPRPSDAELVNMARNSSLANLYFAKYPDNTIYVETDPAYTVTNQPEVAFTPSISEPISFVVNFSVPDWIPTSPWIVCSNSQVYHSTEPIDACLKSVHNQLVAANITSEVQDLLAKYPRIRINQFDSIGTPTIGVYNSTVAFQYRGYWEDHNLKEVHLIVRLDQNSTQVTDFDAKCISYYGPDATYSTYNASGPHIDVEKFLRDDHCPASTSDIFPKYR